MDLFRFKLLLAVAKTFHQTLWDIKIWRNGFAERLSLLISPCQTKFR